MFCSGRSLRLLALLAVLFFPVPLANAQDTTPAPAASAVPSTQPATNPGVPEAAATASSDTGAKQPLPRNLSPWGMFAQADIVVKLVMIGLIFAALLTWTILLAKVLEIAAAKGSVRTIHKAIGEAHTLDEATKKLGTRKGVGAVLIRAANEEVQLSLGALPHTDGSGLKERVNSRLSRIESAAGRRLSRGTGLLATIGSTAPFVGLFGTVWGIMNAFIGISVAQTTNLAVVAPGIAEALLATAMGLIAAIPAVIVYNVFARSITGYRHQLGDLGAAVERLISRDLDYRDIAERR